MIIQWVGGPDDGDLFEMPNGTRDIKVAILKASKFIKANGDEYAHVPVAYERLPIEKVNGRFFVRYPKVSAL